MEFKKYQDPCFDVTSRYGDGVPSHATNPRDFHWVYGNTLYRFESKNCYDDLYNEYFHIHCIIYCNNFYTMNYTMNMKKTTE